MRHITNFSSMPASVEAAGFKGTKATKYGIVLYRRDDNSPLTIKEIRQDGIFSSQGLKPGMIVVDINGIDATWRTPRDAASILRHAEPGKQLSILASKPVAVRVRKARKGTKWGFAVKNSTKRPGVFISRIDGEGPFADTKLMVGMQVVLINGMPCPQDIKQATQIMKQPKTSMDIVAVDLEHYIDADNVDLVNDRNPSNTVSRESCENHSSKRVEASAESKRKDRHDLAKKAEKKSLTSIVRRGAKDINSGELSVGRENLALFQNVITRIDEMATFDSGVGAVTREQVANGFLDKKEKPEEKSGMLSDHTLVVGNKTEFPTTLSTNLEIIDDINGCDFPFLSSLFAKAYERGDIRYAGELSCSAYSNFMFQPILKGLLLSEPDGVCAKAVGVPEKTSTLATSEKIGMETSEKVPQPEQVLDQAEMVDSELEEMQYANTLVKDEKRLINKQQRWKSFMKQKKRLGSNTATSECNLVSMVGETGREEFEVAKNSFQAFEGEQPIHEKKSNGFKFRSFFKRKQNSTPNVVQPSKPDKDSQLIHTAPTMLSTVVDIVAGTECRAIVPHIEQAITNQQESMGESNSTPMISYPRTSNALVPRPMTSNALVPRTSNALVPSRNLQYKAIAANDAILESPSEDVSELTKESYDMKETVKRLEKHNEELQRLMQIILDSHQRMAMGEKASPQIEKEEPKKKKIISIFKKKKSIRTVAESKQPELMDHSATIEKAFESRAKTEKDEQKSGVGGEAMSQPDDNYESTNVHVGLKLQPGIAAAIASFSQLFDVVCASPEIEQESEDPTFFEDFINVISRAIPASRKNGHEATQDDFESPVDVTAELPVQEKKQQRSRLRLFRKRKNPSSEKFIREQLSAKDTKSSESEEESTTKTLVLKKIGKQQRKVRCRQTPQSEFSPDDECVDVDYFTPDPAEGGWLPYLFDVKAF